MYSFPVILYEFFSCFGSSTIFCQLIGKNRDCDSAKERSTVDGFESDVAVNKLANMKMECKPSFWCISRVAGIVMSDFGFVCFVCVISKIRYFTLLFTASELLWCRLIVGAPT